MQNLRIEYFIYQWVAIATHGVCCILTGGCVAFTQSTLCSIMDTWGVISLGFSQVKSFKASLLLHWTTVAQSTLISEVIGYFREHLASEGNSRCSRTSNVLKWMQQESKIFSSVSVSVCFHAAHWWPSHCQLYPLCCIYFSIRGK